METTLNKINITGVLVKNGLEVKNQFEKNEAIAGSLVVRTADGSEHEVRYYAAKYKKDKDTKEYTSEESGLYKSLETIMNEYIALDKDPNADVIRISNGDIGVNDYKNKNNEITTINTNNAKFANRVEPDKVDLYPQEAKFEIEGIITKLEPEVKKDIPTGNGLVYLDAVGYGGNLIPIKLTIPSDLVQPFGGAGFFDGGAAKFTGKLVNTTTTETVVEKQAFGDDNVRTVTNTVRMFEVRGGSPKGTIDTLKITEDEYTQAKNKRRLKLSEILSGDKEQQGFTQSQTNSSPFGQQATPSANPFASAQSNPFGKF